MPGGGRNAGLREILDCLMRPWIDEPEAHLGRLLWRADGSNVPADPPWAAAVKALRGNVPPMGINRAAEFSALYGWYSLRDGMAAADVLVRLGRDRSAIRLLSLLVPLHTRFRIETGKCYHVPCDIHSLYYLTRFYGRLRPKLPPALRRQTESMISDALTHYLRRRCETYLEVSFPVVAQSAAYHRARDCFPCAQDRRDALKWSETLARFIRTAINPTYDSLDEGARFAWAWKDLGGGKLSPGIGVWVDGWLKGVAPDGRLPLYGLNDYRIRFPAWGPLAALAAARKPELAAVVLAHYLPRAPLGNIPPRLMMNLAASAELLDGEFDFEEAAAARRRPFAGAGAIVGPRLGSLWCGGRRLLWSLPGSSPYSGSRDGGGLLAIDDESGRTFEAPHGAYAVRPISGGKILNASCTCFYWGSGKTRAAFAAASIASPAFPCSGYNWKRDLLLSRDGTVVLVDRLERRAFSKAEPKLRFAVIPGAGSHAQTRLLGLRRLKRSPDTWLSVLVFDAARPLKAKPVAFSLTAHAARASIGGGTIVIPSDIGRSVAWRFSP